MNRLTGERDWSAQEVSHILFDLPLHKGSRTTIHFDCRSEHEIGTVIELDPDGNEQLSDKTILDKYKERPALFEAATLFNFLSDFEHGARKVCRPRPNASSRAIVYQPQYSHLPSHKDYEDFCRVKIAIHHPWRQYPELPWKGHPTWALALASCIVSSFPNYVSSFV
jgi:ATP-dependent DNA helicase PIF1